MLFSTRPIHRPNLVGIRVSVLEGKSHEIEPILYFVCGKSGTSGNEAHLIMSPYSGNDSRIKNLGLFLSSKRSSLD